MSLVSSRSCNVTPGHRRLNSQKRRQWPDRRNEAHRQRAMLAPCGSLHEDTPISCRHLACLHQQDSANGQRDVTVVAIKQFTLRSSSARNCIQGRLGNPSCRAARQSAALRLLTKYSSCGDHIIHFHINRVRKIYWTLTQKISACQRYDERGAPEMAEIGFTNLGGTARRRPFEAAVARRIDDLRSLVNTSGR